MKPGYPNGCRGAVMCRDCWQTYRDWFEHKRYLFPRVPLPHVCSSCEEAEMAKRFAESAQKESA